MWATHSLEDNDLIIATRRGTDQHFAVYGDGALGIGPSVATPSTNNIDLNFNGSANLQVVM